MCVWGGGVFTPTGSSLHEKENCYSLERKTKQIDKQKHCDIVDSYLTLVLNVFPFPRKYVLQMTDAWRQRTTDAGHLHHGNISADTIKQR